MEAIFYLKFKVINEKDMAAHATFFIISISANSQAGLGRTATKDLLTLASLVERACERTNFRRTVMRQCWNATRKPNGPDLNQS